MASILQRTSSIDENTQIRDAKSMNTSAAVSKKRPALRDLSNKSSLPNQAMKDKDSPKGSIASRISRLKLDGPREDKPIESVLTLRSVKDIDAGDHKDQMANTEYANDVYRNLWKQESNFMASPDYMSQQTDINERMRKILIDWLVDVHIKFKLRPETLFLTVHIIDRYLSKEQTTRKKLQLVGVTAMLIASKYEEIYAPEVRDFVYISDKAYDRAQILKMEGTILNALDWQLCGATPWHFMLRFNKAGELDEKMRLTANYLMERYLQEMKSVQHLPSKIAAAAVSIARAVHGKSAWSPELSKHARYSEEQLQPIQHELLEFARHAPNSSLKAVYRKYSSSKYQEVAQLQYPSSV
jgi:cyclin B